MSDESAQTHLRPSQPSTDASLESLLGEVAGEYFDRLTGGERPEIEDYVERYPEIAEQIRAAFPALQVVGDSRAGSELPRVDSDLAGRKTLGDFRILHELGRGGMGVVYEAEQLSMGRRVALKVLPFAALAQDKSLQRFRNEVRAAGALNHPNIVPIHSVGEERGVHFFAMQLIRGQTMAEVITQLVRLQNSGQPLQDTSISQTLSVTGVLDFGGSANEPTQEFSTVKDDDLDVVSTPSTDTRRETKARISTEGQTDSRPTFVRSAVRLGVQAAEALQHAHDEGVLHRDIKPGNLMLDAQGQLFITDFGLARIETDVGVTMTGDIVGTLRYMSPEQALAKRIVIDHRSDIYSLGVTLYELLTLRPPFDGEHRQELLKQIAFEDPPKPCQISRSIPRELETVILKAIEKNPDERYSTAAELSEDLQAFLEDRPIKAKPPTLFQRTAKWSRRHKPLVWSASLSIVFLMVAGLILLAISNQVVTKERNQKAAALTQRTTALSAKDDALAEKDKALAVADANFEKAREAVDQMLTRVGAGRLMDVPRMTAIRAELLQDALKFYETLLQQDPDNLLVRSQMANAECSLGTVLKTLAQNPEAESRIHSAITTQEDLVKKSPDNRMFRSRLAGSYNNLGWLLGGPRIKESENAHRSATALYESLMANNPKEPSYRWELAHSYQSIADCLNSQGQLDEAETFARQALGLFRVSDTGGRDFHSAAYSKLAKILQGKNEYEQADTAFANAIRIQRELQHELPLDSPTPRFLALMLLDHGELLQQLQRYDQAQECFTEAGDIWELLMRSYPNAPDYGEHFSDARKALLKLFVATEQTEAMEQLLSELMPVTAVEYEGRARLLQKLGRNDEALANYQKAVELEPDDALRHRTLAIFLNHVLHSEFRDYDSALQHAAKAVELKPDDYSSLVLLASILSGRFNDTTQALIHLDHAAEVAPHRASAYVIRARIHQSNQEYARALEDADKAIQLDPSSQSYVQRARAHSALKHWDAALADYKLAEEANREDSYVYDERSGIYSAQGRYEEALVDLNKSLQIAPLKDWVYKRRGLVHFRLSQFDKALADITRAWELNLTDLSFLTWIPANEIADCPDTEFRNGFLELVDQAVDLNEHSQRALTTRAEIMIAFGKAEQALEDLKAAASYADASYYTSYQAALLALHLNDLPFYQAICDQMQEKFTGSGDLRELHFTAWTCALSPDAIDDYTVAIKLARQTVVKEPGNQQYLNSLGAMLMRSGHYTEGRIELNKALAATESGSTSPGYIRYFLAMTEHYLGHQQAAHDQLETANRSAREELAEFPAWNRKLTIELLRDEAEALIGAVDASPTINANTPEDSSPPSPKPKATIE